MLKAKPTGTRVQKSAPVGLQTPHFETPAHVRPQAFVMGSKTFTKGVPNEQHIQFQPSQPFFSCSASGSAETLPRVRRKACCGRDIPNPNPHTSKHLYDLPSITVRRIESTLRSILIMLASSASPRSPPRRRGRAKLPHHPRSRYQPRAKPRALPNLVRQFVEALLFFP